VEAHLADLRRTDPEAAQALGELAREGFIVGHANDDGTILWAAAKFPD
jgi:hypothetical protein